MKLKTMLLCLLFIIFIGGCYQVKSGQAGLNNQQKAVNVLENHPEANIGQAVENNKNSMITHFDTAKYEGKWISSDYQVVRMDGYTDRFGSELYINHKNDGIIEMNMYDISAPPENRIASIKTGAEISPKGIGGFKFDDDGWGSHGSGTIELIDNQIIINIDSQIEPGKYADWGVYSGKRLYLRGNKVPDTMELIYEEIKPENIPIASNLTLFNKVKTVQLGKADGEQINITLYSDNDNNIHGVFKHKGKEYILKYIGYATDLDTDHAVEIHEVQLTYNTKGKDIILVAYAGSPILGYQYVIFDESDNKWVTYHSWGTPQVIDINHDGIKEVFMQFHGMHLDAPDLNILSFQDGHIMVADINAGVYKDGKLDESKSKIASKYIREQDGKTLVEISDLMGNESPFLYHLESDQQNPSLLRLRKVTN